MESKTIFVISQILMLPLLFQSEEVSGSPILFGAKPPNCPHGKCFIDRCERICSCVPKEGHIHCTKEDFFASSLIRTTKIMECQSKPSNSKTEEEGFCPLGKTYKNPLWGDNFLCNCNNDPSQTYECFDLATQTSADFRDLVQSIKSNVEELISKKLLSTSSSAAIIKAKTKKELN